MVDESNGLSVNISHERRFHRIVRIFLFFILFIAYAYFFQGDNANYTPQFSTIRSLIERQQFDLRGFPTSIDIILYNGNLYSCRAPGNVIVGIVPFSIFLKVLPLLQIPAWLVDHLVVYLTTVTTTGLLTAFIALMLYGILLKVTRDPYISFLSALAYGIGTIAFPFATLFYVHQTSAFFAFAAFAMLFNKFHGEQEREIKGVELFLAGFLVGFSVVTAYPNVFIAGILTVYLFFALKKRVSVVWFIVGGLLAACILLTYNYLAFQDPFFIPYEVYAETEDSYFPEHKEGLLGFTYPKPDILWKLMFPPRRGLFFYNPLLLAMIPGLIILWRGKRFRREFWLIVSVVIVHFAFNASYGKSLVSWGGGGTTGPRHLIPMIPFAMIPASLLFKKYKSLFFILIIPSFVFMLLSTTVNPVLGFERNPLFQYVLPHFLKGHIAFNRFGTFNNTFITEDSVAFNIGLLLGLKSSLSLIPLFIIWLALLSLILGFFIKRGLLISSHGIIIIGFTVLLFGCIAVLPFLFSPYKARFIVDSDFMGLIGYYYKNDSWRGNPSFIRMDSTIDFKWIDEKQPLAPPYSVEWRGLLVAPNDSQYTFYTESDDASWLYIDDTLVVDNGGFHAPQTKKGTITLSQGEHVILIKYINMKSNGTMRLFWERNRERFIISNRNFRPLRPPHLTNVNTWK